MVNKELFDRVTLPYNNNLGIDREFYKDKIENVFKENYAKLLFLKGENIVKESQEDDCLYFIERGKVILTRKDVYGKEYCNGYLLPGEFFGFSAYINMPEVFNYKALTNCNIYAVNIGAIRKMLMEEQAVKAQFDSILIHIMRNVAVRQGNLIMGGCRNSFVNFVVEHLNDFGRVDENGDVLVTLDVNLAEIAVILNMTRETLSRIVSDMKRDGIIETKRRFLRIMDLTRFIA